MRILGFSGKAKAGKSYGATFAMGKFLFDMKRIRTFAIDKDEVLNVWDMEDDDESQPVSLPINRIKYLDMETQNLFYNAVFRFTNTIAFADPLKEHCVKVLGLPWESVYGTNEQKNEPLEHIKWENFSHIKYKLKPGEKKKSGPMTGREVQQFVGTELYRTINPNIWVKSWERQVESSGSEIVFVPDVRFSEEVDAIQSKGGKVIRLMRAPAPSNHESETALDEDKFDHSKFDFILDNRETNIEEYCNQLEEIINGLGWI